METIKSNPKYQALPDEHKARVRADLYHKYVIPSYAGFHLPVPNEKTWVEATGRNTDNLMHQKLSSTYYPTHADDGKTSDYWRHNKETNQDLGAGFYKATNEIGLFGAKVTNAEFLAFHGITTFIGNKLDKALRLPVPKQYEDVAKNYVERKISNYEDSKRANIQDADFWLQTHPRDTIIGRLDGDIGEQVAQLPIYEALSTEKIASAVGVPLTAKLVKSPIGKWVASRLLNTSDGFISSLIVSGGSPKEATEGAAGFATGEAVLGPAGKLAGKVLAPLTERIASAPLIKGWMAHVIAMGGKPLAHELVESAFAEEEQAAKYAEHFNEPSSGEALQAIKDKAALHPYAQEARDWVAKQQERAKNDPVVHKMHEAQKLAFRSSAKAKYGYPLRFLSKAQRELVKAEHHRLVEEAASEAPAHLPDLLHDEVKQNVEQQAKTNPGLAMFDQMLAQHGIKIEDAITEDAITATKQTTGISNKDAAAKKLSKVPRSASLSAPYNIAEMRSPRSRVAFEKSIGSKAKGNFNAFYDQLKDADQRGIKFETPIQRLLFLYNNRKGIPKELGDKLLYRIRQVAKYKNMSPAKIAAESSWVHTHLYDMALSGHFNENESNMYASTKIGDPSKGTKYQLQMKREADVAQIKAVEMVLKNQPKALKAFGASVRSLQKQYASFRNADEYMAYRKALDEIANRTIKGYKSK